MVFRFNQSVSAFLLLALAVFAQAGTPADKATVAKVRAALDSPAMGLKVATVETSEVPGMLEVQFEAGPMVYATEDGSYFILGDLFQVNNGQFVNLAEKRRDKERLVKMEAVDTEDMIVFPAQGDTLAHISVFTDVTCFYCQKYLSSINVALKCAIWLIRALAWTPRGIASWSEPGARKTRRKH